MYNPTMGMPSVLFSFLLLSRNIIDITGSEAAVFKEGQQKSRGGSNVFISKIHKLQPSNVRTLPKETFGNVDAKSQEQRFADNSFALPKTLFFHASSEQNNDDQSDGMGEKTDLIFKGLDTESANSAIPTLNYKLSSGDQNCCRYISYSVDCSYCNLSRVPDNLSPTIRNLDLSNNLVTSDNLQPGVFSNFSQLLVLKLNSNKLTYLYDGIFDGLINLNALFLNNNAIQYNKSLNASNVFKPLNESLTFLNINGNNKDVALPSLMYPSGALSVLTCLNHLYMDGLMGKDFPKGFQELRQLRSLTLSGLDEGSCSITSLSTNTFKYLTTLSHLNISGCHLRKGYVANDTFSPLTNIQVLDISYNPGLSIDEVGNLMFGLQNKTSFKHLRAIRVQSAYSPCQGIFKKTLRYFSVTSLQIIEAADNEIEIIEKDALQMLPASLKVLNMKNNRIIFGAYWQDMGSLNNVETLDLDFTYTEVHFPHFFPTRSLIRSCAQANTTDSSEKLKEYNSIGSTSSEEINNFKGDMLLPLPPHLKNFTMRNQHLSYIFENIRFRDNELRFVDLSGNYIKHLKGPIHGIGLLTHFVMTSSSVSVIDNTFFDTFQSLEHLNLYRNQLGDCVADDTEGQIFKKLYNLKYLNISLNNLHSIPSPAFKNLTKLQVLDLSVNTLNFVDFQIAHMENLRFLKLRKNRIQTLPSDVRHAISRLLEQNKTIVVDMRNNPILCNCDNLEFLEWVQSTSIFGTNYSKYFCSYSTVSYNIKNMTEGYEEEIIRLQRQCKTQRLLFLFVFGATFIMAAVLLVSVAYRFRWTLRYWYHAAKMRLSQSRANNAQAGNFDFDVFVSYCNEDIDFILQELKPKLEQRNLTLMLHGDGFQTGRHIADNVYMAVTRCRKTLVVITRSMLDSYWCMYELQIARMESLSTGRSVLAFLLLEEIPSSQISGEVLAYIKTSTYTVYPRNANHRAAFWDNLASDLRAEY